MRREAGDEGPGVGNGRRFGGWRSPTSIDGSSGGSDGEDADSRGFFGRASLDGVYRKLRAHMSPTRARRFPPEGTVYKNYFTEKQLLALQGYKHSGADHSITYKYVLSPLYTRLIDFIPMWMPPNTVTLTGLGPLFLVHFLLLYFSPYLDTEAPRIVHAAAGMALFFYQIMDNLDGKQARRTGSSSPLGHLFDHLCDALNVTISGVSVAASLGLGSSVWSVVLVYGCGFLVFYNATLEEYVSGKMVLRSINGPNEGLLFMQCIHYVTAIFGLGIWQQQVATFRGVPLHANNVLMLISIPAFTLTVVFNYVEAGKELWRRGFSTAQIVSRITWPSLPMIWFSAVMLGWIYLSPSVVEDHCVLFLWTFGLNFLFLVTLLILSHLTHSEFPAFVPHVAPLALGVINTVAGRYTGDGSSPLVPHLPVLLFLLVWTILGNARRIYCMGLQICEYLDIAVFKIKPVPAEKSK